jgi:hypothetical protein
VGLPLQVEKVFLETFFYHPTTHFFVAALSIFGGFGKHKEETPIMKRSLSRIFCGVTMELFYRIGRSNIEVVKEFILPFLGLFMVFWGHSSRDLT